MGHEAKAVHSLHYRVGLALLLLLVIATSGFVLNDSYLFSGLAVSLSFLCRRSDGSEACMVWGSDVALRAGMAAAQHGPDRQNWAIALLRQSRSYPPPFLSTITALIQRLADCSCCELTRAPCRRSTRPTCYARCNSPRSTTLPRTSKPGTSRCVYLSLSSPRTILPSLSALTFCCDNSRLRSPTQNTLLPQRRLPRPPTTERARDRMETVR